MNKRILYLDNLKGFAIFLVVMGHICPIYSNIYISNIIYGFHMALFFFISGYISTYFQTITSSILFVKRKFFALIIPYLSVCVLAIGVNYNKVGTLKAYFLSETRSGYWFLPTLFIAFVALSIIQKYVFENRSLIKFISFAVIIEVSFVVLKFSLPQYLVDFLCIRHLATNWPFFILGVLHPKFESSLKHKSFLILSGLAFVTIIFIQNVYEITNEELRMLSRLFGTYFFYFIFNEYLNNDNYIVSFFNKCGQASLSIYIFHFFFIFIAQYRLPFILPSEAIIMLFALLICSICLFLHFQLIQKCKTLKFLFTGKLS
jgi:fucose 4-O-acetylase-like acetyltransferase